MRGRLAYKARRGGERVWGMAPLNGIGRTVRFYPENDVPDNVMEVGEVGTIRAHADGLEADLEVE